MEHLPVIMPSLLGLVMWGVMCFTDDMLTAVKSGFALLASIALAVISASNGGLL